MIVKRTKVLTSPRAVMKWAGEYIDEARKHKGENLEELGIGIGKNYFTSRPVGAITAHGYAKDRTETISVARGLKGNDAVLAMLKEHCRERKMKKRKIYGVRFVMSLDPEKTAELAPKLVDIDRLLVRSIEDTIAVIEEKYYPGDRLGYVLGIHHDAITKDQDKPARPHIHAHALFLPQTENGLRISFSNHTQPKRDGKFHDMLDALLETYRAMTMKHIYSLVVTPEPPSTPEWLAVLKECAYHAADDMKESPKMEPARTRRFVLDKFSFYLTTSTRENIRLRYNYRMNNLMKKAPGSLPDRWAKFGKMLDESINYANQRLAQQSQPLADAASHWIPERDHEVKIWEFSPKAVLIRKPTRRMQNRKDQIKEMFDEMQLKRQAYRVNLLGELASDEYQLGRLTGEVPEWMQTLGKIGSGELPMPNRDIFREVTSQEKVESAAQTPEDPALDETSQPEIIGTHSGPG